MANKSTGQIANIGVLLFFGVGFLLLPMLPWAELGLTSGPAQIGPFTISLSALDGLYKAAFDVLPERLKTLKDDPNYSFYVYSFILGLAMISASIGLNLVGREESEEKTILPVKK
jgi:hypothetical protein